MRCYDAVMRTTVNLDDDVAEAVRSLARSEGRPLGQVLSELARRGLRPVVARLGQEGDFPVFEVPADAALVTTEMVRAALDEE